jgi:tRNA dimethylallyltransferase
VPHYGVGVVEPTERWSAARWADDAERWIADAAASGRHPLLVGGTGFYLRALAEPLFAEPPLDPDRRRMLEGVLAGVPGPELRRWAHALDPARAHLQRTQLLRAVEVALLTGERLSAWHARTARPPRYRLRYLVVDPGPALADPHRGARGRDARRRVGRRGAALLGAVPGRPHPRGRRRGTSAAAPTCGAS